MCVKRCRPIIRVKNNSQEKFAIFHVPHIGFLGYLLDSRRDFIIGSCLEKKEFACCFWRDFVKFDV